MRRLPTDALSRVRLFSRALQDRTATRALRFPGGTALFNERFTHSWTHNLLRVDPPEEGLSAHALAAQAEALHGDAGHTHRRVWVDDEAVGERLAEGFRSLGWLGRCEWVMAHSGEAPPADSRIAVRELAPEEVRPFWEEMFRRTGDVRDEETVRQLTERNHILGRQLSVRHFGAICDGRIASACDLYPGGELAEVQDVETLEEYRGRGLARAVMAAALRATRERGTAFTFLMADAEDWPKEFYGRLGFQVLGKFFVFTRTPGNRSQGGSEVGGLGARYAGE